MDRCELDDLEAYFLHPLDVQESFDSRDVLHRGRLGEQDDRCAVLHREYEPTESIEATRHHPYPAY